MGGGNSRCSTCSGIIRSRTCWTSRRTGGMEGVWTVPWRRRSRSVLESDHHPYPVAYPEDYDNDNGGNAPPDVSWRFVGDLYRKVTLYKNVKWGSGGKGAEGKGGANASDDASLNSGLAAFPPRYLSTFRRPDGLLDARDVRELLSTTTVTKVAGCPNGGPIAAITLPTTGSLPTAGCAGNSGGGQQPAGPMSSTELRIMMSSGRSLSSVEFPPPSLALNARRLYSAADVLTIGFTDRTVLVMVLRDSLCLCYDLSGNLILPPFHILPGDTRPGDKSGTAGVELLEATVFGGGVAVLSASMNAAVVELLDEHDSAYADAAHCASKKILPTFDKGGGNGSAATGMGETFGGASNAPPPPNFAIVTRLPTAKHASNNNYSYCTLAVLPRNHATSGHPELFLSTSDNSVIIVDVSTTKITDVDCRSRISSPIISMSFAPNGRFLACFTRGSLLTVISTSFKTKVLDFDLSEAAAAPPRDMKWCGDDVVVLHWKNFGVLMVDPNGDWLRYPFEHMENLHIVSDIDCCRIVTDTSVEKVQRFPPTSALLAAAAKQWARDGQWGDVLSYLKWIDKRRAGIPDGLTADVQRMLALELADAGLLDKARETLRIFSDELDDAAEDVHGGSGEGGVEGEESRPSRTIERKIGELAALRSPKNAAASDGGGGSDAGADAAAPRLLPSDYYGENNASRQSVRDEIGRRLAEEVPAATKR